MSFPRLRRKRSPRRFGYKSTLERLEERAVPTATWNNFGGNAQHADVAEVAAQPIDQLLWQVPLDLAPWGFIHYGDPIFTPNNVAVVPIKVTWGANNPGATNFIEVGLNDVTGAVLWSTAPMGSITGASNVGNTIVITTNNTKGLANGDYVTIGDMQGDTAANTGPSNEMYQITHVTSTSFTLENVTGNGTYTGGGLWVLSTTSSAVTSYIEPAYNWLPPDQAAYDPVTNRVYFPGPGGTIDYISNPDTATGVVTPVQEAFYGISNYTKNPVGYDASIYINTPLTVDAQGNIYFGYAITGINPSHITEGGIARISASGAATNVSAFAAADTAGQTPSDDGNWVAALGSAPALSNDGSTVYFAVDDGGYDLYGNEYDAYLVGLNSRNLQPEYSVRLYDPTTGSGVPATGVQTTGIGAGVIDISTASPMVAPDGTIYMGVFSSNYNGSRGSLLHFSGNLQTEYIPGAFGWDDTPSIIPTSMVPSYTGSSSYLILSKYNNYANAETGSSGGNGVNEIAILDPYASQPDPNNDPEPNGQPMPVMKQILTLASPSPDINNINAGDPDAVREWCTNGTAVDPATDSIFVNNEDGYTYEWNLGTNTITHTVEVNPGYAVPYTPTAISPNGEVFSDNGGTLFALGGYSNYSITTVSSANPAVYGTPITLTTTLASTSGGPTPTGTITYTAYAGANNPLNYDTTPINLGTATLNAKGVATLTLSGTLLQAAHYHITASYSGDSNDSAGHTTIVLPVLETVTTAVSASANPVASGTNVTFTATLTPNGTPSTVVPNGTGSSLYWVPIGAVTFMDGSTVLGTVNLNPLETGGPNGDGSYPSSYIQQVTFTTSTLPVGTNAITAVYSGDQNFASGTSAVSDETVGGTTTTVVSSAPNPSDYGQKVTFTAAVTAIVSGSGIPTGIVTFFDGTRKLGTAVVNGTTGQATYTTTALALTAGSNSITASYGGNTNFAASTSSVFTQTVNKDDSATTVTSSANPSVYGQKVTLTAVVTAQAPGSGTATGTVAFYDGSTELGTAVLNSIGRASLTTTAFALSLGQNSITAKYGGGANFKASASTALNVTVNQDTTTAKVASSAAPAVVGQGVTFTATVTANSPGSGVPTGIVTFYDGTTRIGTGTLNSSGKATLTISSLVRGSHSISVSYRGDTDYQASTSAVLAETIDQAATGTVVTSSHDPSVFGQSVTFTATVTVKSPGSGVPTGTVIFYDGTTQLGTGTLNSAGQATFTTSSLAVGNDSITAVYYGDTNFTSSTSASLSQNVDKASTTTTLASSLNPVPTNTLVTFTATVLPKAPGGGMPTGSVTFYDGTTVLGTIDLNVSGQASWTTSWSTPGKHVIKAVYSGDGDFLSSTSALLTETVS
jgi:hypothetical protein